METLFTVHNKKLIFKDFHDYINIWFFGDVHRDVSSCDVDRWKAFLKEAREDDPEKTYYMGMGDYHDFASSNEQKKMTRDLLHETTMDSLEDLVYKRNRQFCSEIKQMNGKLLGMLDGNHNWRFANGVTASEDLANRMGCDHLGWLCYYSLSIEIGNKYTSVDIVVCHGKAGGKRAGTTINQVEDLKTIFPLADIYIMGHDHNRGAWPVDVLHKVNGKIKQKRQFLCRSGSFKKAYQDGRSGYEVGRLFRPSDLGALKLKVMINRDRKSPEERLITDIRAYI